MPPRKKNRKISTAPMPIAMPLIERAPQECVEFLRRMVEAEMGHRKEMLRLHPGQHAYWRQRISELHEAHRCIDVLEKEVSGHE